MPKFILFTVFLVFSSSVLASVENKVDELLVLSGSEQFLSKEFLIKSTQESIESMAAEGEFSAEKIEQMKKSSIEPIENMNMQSLRSSVYELYLDTYSEKEIDDLITFYKSSTGKKMVAKQPYVIQRVQKILRDEMFKPMKAVKSKNKK